MISLEADLERFHKIDSLHNEALLEYFKGIILDGWGQSGPNFYSYMHKENRHFVNSEYYYNGELEFFHLTPLNNLWSIINSRAFRLYNLHSSQDPDEYSYAGKILELSDEMINLRKQYSYTFSFCPISELKNKNVWESYGSNFQGAAIVFRIENDPKEWMNFHISEIKYEASDSFRLYRKRAKEIEKEYPGIKLSCDLSQLICFHKTAKWQGEKEVRIATYFPYQRTEEYLKYSKSEFRLEKGRNRVTNYIEMPLWVDNDSSLIKSHFKPELDRMQHLPEGYFNIHPKIKIKNIIIGINSGLEIKEFGEFRRILLDTIRFNYGYNIDIDYNLFKL